MATRSFMFRAFVLLAVFAVLAAQCAPAPTATELPPAEPTKAEAAAEPTKAEAAAEPTKLTLRIGRFPYGAGAAFVTAYMRDEKLVEKAGAELGYDLTVEWSEFPTAVPVTQALAADKLDIGPMGSTAGLNLINNDQPVTPISNAEGHFKVLLVTRPDSGVRSLEGLKGKTVATIVGSDLYNILGQMLLGTFGTAEPEEAGVGIVNVDTPAQLAAVPQGADASIVTLPSFLKAEEEVGTVPVVNSYGYTESYYKGELGEGAGILLPAAEKSVFWPEGFYGHRALFVARDAIIQEHPKAVAAFLIAQQRAIAELSQWDPADAAALSEADWGLPAEKGKQIVENDLLMTRGWSFLTEGDANILYLQTELLAKNEVFEEPMSWDKLKTYLAKSGEAAKIAWEALGEKPSMEVMLDTSKDNRGHPTWETDQWAATPKGQ
jgi:ABC-type nitrate/sulfonate/bicarbonate transport system substrate-binding protein